MEMVREKEVPRMATTSSFAERDGWVAFPKAGTTGGGQGEVAGGCVFSPGHVEF